MEESVWACLLKQELATHKHVLVTTQKDKCLILVMILDDFQEIVSGEVGLNFQHALKVVVVEHKDDLDLNQ